MMINKHLRTFGLILYILGTLLAFALMALSVWGDLEASTFDAAVIREETLTTLNCPVLMTQNETGIISAVIKNESDRDATPNVQARITEGYVSYYSEDRRQISVPAHSETRVEWEIFPENAAYNSLVLVSIYQFQNLSLPSRQSSCGVVLLPFSGPTGVQLFWGGMIVGVIAIAAGLYFYHPKREYQGERISTKFLTRQKLYRAYVFLSSYILIATLLTLLGNWMASTLLMLFAVISIIATLSYAAISR